MIFVSKKQKKHNKFLPSDWAEKCPEPCIVHKESPLDKNLNRTITEFEKNLHFLSTHIHNLNQKAEEILTDVAWQHCYKQPPFEISRVSTSSPYFGKHKYRIRFVGYHGLYSVPVILVSLEDESNKKIITPIDNEIFSLSSPITLTLTFIQTLANFEGSVTCPQSISET